MSAPDDRMQASRRRFLASAAAMGSGLGAGFATRAAAAEGTPVAPSMAEPFWGEHQGGIITTQQQHSYFAAFDLLAGTRAEVAAVLRAWTEAAARMAAGQTAQPLEAGLHPVAVAAPYYRDGKPDFATMPADTGEAFELAPARLTLTFGFGAGLFEKDGKDRYGLRARRPEAFVDLRRFKGDQLVPERTGGDLSVQACADDPQVAFHAIRQLARLAEDAVQIRWAQTGFLPRTEGRQTPRNLMGFKDGTGNPSASDAAAMENFVWVGGEGPDWMQGGSYLVARRIHIALEQWDRVPLAFQEQAVGRHKYSGAPLGQQHEFDPVDMEGGGQVEYSHVRLANPLHNGGARILRRAYSYNDGLYLTNKRWPPRPGMEFDAGPFFLCYQRDPRTGFIRIFERMAQFDIAMNRFVTHVGGGMFACPRGAAAGEYIGQRLFEGV